VEGYAEPFAASGHFSNFGELAAPRSKALRVYGVAPGTGIQPGSEGGFILGDGTDIFTLPHVDFNRLSFRSNLVLRWEWLPGSTAFLIWQQSRRQSDDATGRLIVPRDLLDASRSAGDNFLVAKVSYWCGDRSSRPPPS
jgi:hypothetical protein